MLKYDFNHVPDFIKLPENLKEYSGTILYDEKQELFDFLEKQLFNILKDKNFDILFFSKILNFKNINEKIIDFKGAFGSKKILKYNKEKKYSEKFIINNELFYFDVASFHYNNTDNKELFLRAFNSNLCFLRSGSKYIFFINFLDVRYGVLFLNPNEINFNNIKNVNYFEFKEMYIGYNGLINGIDILMKYKNLDVEAIEIVKKTLDI
nr:hypothetical protein [Acinetobacter sp. Marseille-Q1620]